MFVQLVEIHSPVAVVAGLAQVGPLAAPADRFAAGESFIRVVDDGRDPYGSEAHVADISRIVDHAFEVAAQVADVVAFTFRRAGHGAVKGVVHTALVALVVGGVAIDEAVGQHEVDGFAGEGFGGAVEITRSRMGMAHTGQRQGEEGQLRHTAPHTTFSTRTRNTHRPAMIQLMPAMISA